MFHVIQGLSELPQFLEFLIDAFQALGFDEFDATWLAIICFGYLIITIVTFAHCQLRLTKTFAPRPPQEVNSNFIGDQILMALWLMGGYGFWRINLGHSLSLPKLFIESLLVTAVIIFACRQFIYNPLYERACRQYKEFYNDPQSFITVGNIKVVAVYWREILRLLGNEKYALEILEILKEQWSNKSNDKIIKDLLEDLQTKTNSYIDRRDFGMHMVHKGGFYLKVKDWKTLLKLVHNDKKKAIDWLVGIECYYPNLRGMYVIALAIDWIPQYPSSFDPLSLCQREEVLDLDEFDFPEVDNLFEL